LKFYRLRTNRTLYGFGDDAAELPVLGLTLGIHQQRTVEAIGAELVDVESEDDVKDDNYIIFDEHTLFTKKAAQYVYRSSQLADASRNFVFADNSFNRRFVLPCSSDTDEYLRLPLYYRNRANESTDEVIIPQQLYANWARLPPQIVPGGKYRLDQCDTLVAPLLTPFHLLQANMYMNLTRSLWLRKLSPGSREKNVPNLNTRSYYRGLRLLNRFGKRCRIHPTAVVEGAVLGDDVTVGAHAVVRLSCVGSGTTIDDQASVTYSVIGRESYIANKNHLAFCLTYDGVFLIHGPYQFSVFGRGSAVFATINCDVRMDNKTIRIGGPDGVIDSQQHFLGVAYGHGAKVAGGNIVAPGRLVPNGHVQLPPDFIVKPL
jgi:hypothetical protein